LGTLVQMLPSSVVAAGVSAQPELCLATWVVAVAATAVTAGLSIARRRPPGGPWACVDVAIAVSVLVAGTATVPEDLRAGSWVGFQPGHAIAVACSLVAVRRLWLWGCLVIALAVAQLLFMQPLLMSHSVDVASAAGHLLTLLVLSLLTRAGANAFLRLAQTADDSKTLAVAAGQEEEARRGRAAVHNATATMRLLLDLDSQTGTPPTGSRGHLVAQASRELARMRTYLRRDDLPPDDLDESPPGTLREVVARAALESADLDLDLDLQTDLAPDVQLGRELSADLCVALRSLLLNVRRHAQAQDVVVHATETSPPGRWQLTVHDDGVGFDVDSTPQAAGLADVVIGQLAQHDIEVVINSLPGCGTTVTLAGGAIEHRHRGSRPSTGSWLSGR
jgi:signal transduction histidine kinase